MVFFTIEDLSGREFSQGAFAFGEGDRFDTADEARKAAKGFGPGYIVHNRKEGLVIYTQVWEKLS